VRRDAFGRNAQGIEEPADRLSGDHGGAGRVEAAQVHMQLPAGEPVRDLVRQYSANAVLPTPAVPPIALITGRRRPR
jgi:hypothetical protein